jgi:vacuolar-type H+-ATPase subunit I/STV1
VSSEDNNNAQKKIPNKKKGEETTNRNPEDVDDSNIIVISPSETGSKAYEADQSSSSGEVESVSTKVKEAGMSLRELVLAFGRKAKTATESTSKEIKSKATDVTTPDAKDVQTLGANVDTIIAVFEDTMDEIHKEDYDEQEKLLAGYKKYLESQTKVVDTRLNLAKRLKRGA